MRPCLQPGRVVIGVRFGPRILCACVVLLTTIASAAPVWISSLETPDGGTLGSTADSFECKATSPGGDSTAGLSLISASPVAIPHNGRNGGHSSSYTTFRVNTTLTSPGYCEVGANSACTASVTPYVCCTGSGTGNCSFSGLTQGAIGFSVHQYDDLGAAATIMSVHETTSRTTGCYARENVDRTVTACYSDCTTGINFGTTALKLQRDFCTGGSCTTDADCSPDKGICDTTTSTCYNVTKACTAATQATDCPSTQTCATCSTATGAGCYHAGLELVQINQGSKILCELWWDGFKAIGGAPQPASPGSITAFRFGKSSAENGTAVISFDDVVITGDDRAYYGYVSTFHPTANYTGATEGWSIDNCGGGATDFECVDDYTAGGNYGHTGTQSTLKATTSSKQEAFANFTSLTGLGKILAVNSVVIGRTSGAGTGTASPGIGHAILSCADNATCAYSGTEHTASIVYQTATHGELDRAIWTANPDPAATSWSDATLATLGLRFTSKNVVNNTTLRVGAVLIYARTQRADQAAPITLRDHDIGTNDGKITVCTNGDSTNGGTLAVTCQGGDNDGVACGQADYCSDFVATQDKPVGGCNSTDSICQTCQGSVANPRSLFNGGAGYGCGPNNQSLGVNGTCALGTCSGSTCTGDTTVACSVDADCDMGLCDSCDTANCTGGASNTPGSTCVESCPGGACPTNRTSWGAFLTGTTCPDGASCSIGADNIIQVALGLENTTTYAATRGTGALQGRDYWALALQGTGVCECTTGTAVADCGAGGVCTNSLCTAGDAAKLACRSSFNDCNVSNLRVCNLPQCDYNISWEGTNDTLVTGANSDCTGVPGAQAGLATGVICGLQCPRLACVLDSTCTAGRAADSACLGGQSSLTADVCTQTVPGAGACTEQVLPCNSASECPTSFTCSGGTVGGTTPTGFCSCGTADADPGLCSIYDVGSAHFACKANVAGTSGVCRLKCSADATCGTGMTCPASAVRTCQGRCTCPCDSNDIPGAPNAAACVNDGDCYPRTVTDNLTPFLSPGVPRKYGGKCVGGKCRCCGITTCTDGRCDESAARYQGFHGHHRALDAIASINTQLATLNPGDTDGGPVLIWTTLPPPNQIACDATSGHDDRYYRGVNQHLLHDRTKYPHVIDFAGRESHYDQDDIYGDPVHPNPLGASILGGAAVQYLQSLNVCATNAATPQSTALKYCRSNAGAWTTRTCFDNGGCRTAEVCSVRGCGTCTCSNATDCAASGGTCTSSQCAAGDTKRTACVRDGDCNTGKTCTFSDTNCPGTGDTCNGPY